MSDGTPEKALDTLLLEHRTFDPSPEFRRSAIARDPGVYAQAAAGSPLGFMPVVDHFPDTLIPTQMLPVEPFIFQFPATSLRRMSFFSPGEKAEQAYGFRARKSIMLTGSRAPRRLGGL